MRARHIRATWASHCNRFVFFSNKNDSSLPAVDLGVWTGRWHLWHKTRAMLKYIRNEIDWVISINILVIQLLKSFVLNLSRIYLIYIYYIYGSRMNSTGSTGPMMTLMRSLKTYDWCCWHIQPTTPFTLDSSRTHRTTSIKTTILSLQALALFWARKRFACL